MSIKNVQKGGRQAMEKTRIEEISNQELETVRLSLEEYEEYVKMKCPRWGGNRTLNKSQFKVFVKNRTILRQLSSGNTEMDLITNGFGHPLLVIRNGQQSVEITADWHIDESTMGINGEELEGI